MGFANELMSGYLAAKDLSERMSANINDAALVPTDPSRERYMYLIQFIKLIPLAQLFDSKASALEDTSKR